MLHGEEKTETDRNREMEIVRLILQIWQVVRAYSAGGHGGAGTWGGARCTSLPQAGIGQPFRLQRRCGTVAWWEKSASRRRAVAALWRAAKAEGWTHSKTLARMPDGLRARSVLKSAAETGKTIEAQP